MSAHTDIAAEGWIARLPAVCRPYALLARLDRPIGIWLLFLPGLWGILLARPAPARAAWLVLLFALGSVVMRAAGCVVNDLWDRDIDRKVARTAARPLASGMLRPRAALAFLVALLLVGLAILLALGPLARALGRGVADPGRAVSAGQAGNVVAATGDGLHLRLRRPARLCRRRGPDRRRLGSALRGGDPLGFGFRHDLRPSGPRGRRAGRGQVHRAAVRRANPTISRRLLRSSRWGRWSRPDGSRGSAPRSGRFWSSPPACSSGRCCGSTSTTRRCVCGCFG